MYVYFSIFSSRPLNQPPIPIRLPILFICLLCTLRPQAQDSSNISLISPQYFETVSSKASKYYNDINSKTEKTLEKLVKWENKIKSLLQKINPEASARLFNNNQITFSALLQKYKEGKVIIEGHIASYDNYRDKLNTAFKYLEQKKDKLNSTVLQPFNDAKSKLSRLNDKINNAEALQELIKERKKLLVQQVVKYLGQNKYLQKISKESYYYLETLRNYKELFSDPKKVEELALKLLRKIPGFNDFLEKNSFLASIFGSPGAGGNPNGTVGLLQSRTMVQVSAQNQLRAAGPNPQQVFQQAMQLAQGQLNQLRQQVSKFGGNGSDFEVPDFKPNEQRSKKFFQKIEVSANIQTVKNNSRFPVSSDFGFSVGYKPSNKFVVGIGGAYRLGWGSSFRDIHITHQGIGLRSFLEFKLRGNLFISSGYEQNYFSEIRNIAQLNDYSSWKSSALLGISKKYNIGKKKKGEMKLLYDFFSYSKIPKTSPVLFRIGFGL